MDDTHRTALVTGASSGIDREITQLLAADGVDLVLVARNRARLTELADALQTEHRVPVRIEATDLSEPNAAVRLWHELSDANIAIDILVNNAGYGVYGAVHDHDPTALEKMLQVNVVALTSLARLALPRMRARPWGRILNVGSVVGCQPGGPGMAGYYASKAYVMSFSKSLARELDGSGVSVTLLARGVAEWSFEERSRAGKTRLYKLGPKMKAAVARAGYEGMKRGSTVVIPGLWNKLIAFAGELPPRRIALEVNRWLLGAYS